MYELREEGTIPLGLGAIDEVHLESRLGQGGFAEVWKVRDPVTERLYALKVVRGMRCTQTFVERLRREADIRIPSPYVIPVVGMAEGRWSFFFILFEYFEGRDLKKVMDQDGDALNEDRLRIIFTQLLHAVHDAHQCSVIHRDLKPENILVGKEDQLRVIDFGIAKVKDRELTESGRTFGTPSYMSPEILFKGAKVADARADIYALGHILYELVTGHTYWERMGWRGQYNMGIYLINEKPASVISTEDFDCPFLDNAEEVLLKMTARAPEDRFASVREVMEAFGLDVGRLVSANSDTLDAERLGVPALTIETGSNKGAMLVLSLSEGQSRSIGRRDLAGDDKTISRPHFKVSRSLGRYLIEDLDSKRGTLLRGERLGSHPVPLAVGDLVKVGELFLRFDHI